MISSSSALCLHVYIRKCYNESWGVLSSEKTLSVVSVKCVTLCLLWLIMPTAILPERVCLRYKGYCFVLDKSNVHMLLCSSLLLPWQWSCTCPSLPEKFVTVTRYPGKRLQVLSAQWATLGYGLSTLYIFSAINDQSWYNTMKFNSI